MKGKGVPEMHSRGPVLVRWSVKVSLRRWLERDLEE